MKIYSNSLDTADVREATIKARGNGADIYIEAIRNFNPRNYANGVEFWAESANGKRASAHAPVSSGPRDGYPRAASWTDYGYLIAHLFNVDPHARIGFYDNEADFVKKVRAHQPRGGSLAFLDVLDNIGEYPVS